MTFGRVSFDLVAADYLETASSIAGGLNLEDMGESGYDLANKLRAVAAHLRKRDRETVEQEIAQGEAERA